MKKESVEILRRLFGTPGEDFARDISERNPPLARLIDEVALERIWGRPGLPLREKSLITMASQAALGRWDQVKMHMDSFLQLGGTEGELAELLFHLALYCGFPAAIAGFRVLDELRADRAKV